MPQARDEESTSSTRRALIVGGPGTGKTTFASLVASALHLPHRELDRMAYDPPPSHRDAPFWRWTRVADDERRERAAALAATPAWVAEGLYAGWTAALRDAADVVVWLDLPARVTTWRALRRAVEHRWRGGHDWDIRSALRVARGARSYRTRPSATAEQLRERDGANGALTLEVFLRPAADKVIHCRTTAQARRTIERLSNGIAET
jgi:adenylate kinase family enzyme